MDRERYMPPPVQEMSTTDIAVSMVKDTQLLIERQIERVRLEVHDKSVQGQKALMLGAAGAIFAAGTLVSVIFMVTRILERYAGIAPWVGFAISAGTLLLLTVVVVLAARHLLREMMPEPLTNKSEPAELEGRGELRRLGASS